MHEAQYAYLQINFPRDTQKLTSTSTVILLYWYEVLIIYTPQL
jgi:hypothetical protein